jgi:uncharacterized protein
MKCPVCEGVNLAMGERQGVEIDYCPKYRGVWLDRGELDKIIQRSVPQQGIRQFDSRREEDEQDNDRRYDNRSWLNGLFD